MKWSVHNRPIVPLPAGHVKDASSPEDNRHYAHRIANAVHAESAVRFYGEPLTHVNEQCASGRSIDLPLWTWLEHAMYPFP